MTTNQSIERFKKARWLANMRSILTIFSEEDSKHLVSFEEILKLTKSNHFQNLGIQTIKIDDIIGSEGRCEDFNRRFLPLNDALRTRWANIDRLNDEQKPLPPILVYKVGDYYFVRDGNHRVSVAKSRNQIYIDAEVTELMIDAPITKEMTMKDRLLIRLHTEFHDATGFKIWSKGNTLNFTDPENYNLTLMIIQKYRDIQNENAELTFEEAAKKWYYEVFLPFAEDAYLNDLLAKFNNRTTGDLYVWVQLRLQQIEDYETIAIHPVIPLENKIHGTPNREIRTLQMILKKRSQHSENYLFNDYLSIVMINILLSMNSFGEIDVVLVKRKYHPYENMWSLPISMLAKDETRKDASRRCIRNVLGIEDAVSVTHFTTFDKTNRTPFGRIMAFCCIGFIDFKNWNAHPGEIAKEVKISPVTKITELVYDHKDAIKEALKFLVESKNNFSLMSRLFPDTFTLSQIEKYCEFSKKALTCKPYC